jgi:hypothetical protein
MPEAFASVVAPADVDTVWSLFRDFDGLPVFHPGIPGSELRDGARRDQVGAVRDLTLGDGGKVVERLVALDDRARRLTYAILESPFPVRDYLSTMSVLPVTSTGECVATWSVVFDCDLDDSERLSAFFADDVFGAGLAGLVAHLSPTA